MTVDGERWLRIEAILDETLELPVERRNAVLDEACRDDDELRREVEALLAADAQSGDFLETPAGDYAGDLLADLWHDGEARLVGREIGPYRVLEAAGRGGMGVVYKALDTRLGRHVALKLLPESWGRDAGAKERFTREARAASALDHPNICTLHDVGETNDGRLYIVMAYYRGETLEERLRRGPVPVAEAREIAVQAARGLARAHAAGIVHRDVKPANLILTEDADDAPDRVKILDFGIAKVAGEAEVTRADNSPGTPSYLSPERARGESSDARTDVWSLGVVLYEMIAGRRPFRSVNSQALIYQILHGDPEPLEEVCPAVPPDLARTVSKALAKDPAERYAGMTEMLADLEPAAPAPRRPAWLVAAAAAVAAALTLGVWWLSLQAPAAVPVPSVAAPAGDDLPAVAVLPLDDLSNDPEQGFFAEGMTEALITELSRISGLRVISRTSTAPYRDSPKPIAEVAEELGVGYALVGSVLRAGDRVRISTQLIDGRRDRNLWAEAYERPLSDVLGLQREVARAVAEQIEVRLTPRERASLSASPPVDPEAYVLYLRGRALWNQRTRSSLARSAELYERALAIEPRNVLALVGLAEAYQMLGESTYASPLPTREADQRAVELARRALEIDPTLGEAYAVLALVDVHRFAWQAAELKYRRALALSPSYPTAHQWYGEMLMVQKRWDEAWAACRQAERLDPLAPIIRGQIGRVLIFQRRFDDAVKHFQEQIAEHPNFWLNHYGLSYALMGRGDLDEALAASRRAVALGGGELAAIAQARARSYAGDPGPARELLREYLAPEGTRRVAPMLVAHVAVAAGETEKALDSLEEALARGDEGLPELNVAFTFDPLRDEPRFQAVLRAIGLAES